MKALAQNNSVLTGPAVTMDQSDRSGLVLFRSDFSRGFEGWRDHFNGHTPLNQLSLTDYPAMNSKALRLSTGAEPYVSGAMSATVSAYKNMSMYRTTGLVSFSGFFAIGGGDAHSYAAWGISFDIQRPDNSSRTQPRLQIADSWSTSPDVWQIIADDGSTINIPNSRGVYAGENENKYNFNYVRLTIDLSANGGVGGYHEAQINEEVFDLTGLGGGSGATAPQGTTAGDFIGDFRSGNNCGISLYRTTRSGRESIYPATLICDNLVCTVQD